MKQEKLQINFFDELEDLYEKEWKGMPEFNMTPEVPIFTLKLSFKTEKDIEEFAKLINQKVTKTRENYWFPKLNRNAFSELKYVDDES
ncbi:MAG: hypothetical protein ACK5B9_13340 [Flavobacteriia bacterium]|jgi:hypothetical protein